jgi:hypothetical protein
MKGNRRLWLSVIAIALIVATLALPMTASAGRAIRQSGFMFVPPFARQAYTLSVGRVSVTVPPKAMPWGGVVYLRVVETPSGHFVADFLPDRDFDVPVTMDYDTAPWVDYYSKRGPVRIWTTDGRIDSWHFSRYSGWF